MQVGEGFTLPSETTSERPGRSASGHRPARPKERDPAGHVPNARYDQWSRYLIPGTPDDPTGPDQPFTRVTTIVGNLMNTDGLRVWTEREMLRGLAGWGAGRALLASHPDDKQVIDRIREESKTRAGMSDPADYGTAWHRELQRALELERDGQLYDGPPDELSQDVSAALAKLKLEGLRVWRCELLAVNVHLRVAGRLDHLWQHGERVRVGDGKTGKDACDAKHTFQIQAQLGGYANMTHLVEFLPDGGVRWHPMPDVDRLEGYLLAVRNGVAELGTIDIAQGWKDFLHGWAIHRDRQQGGTFVPIGVPYRQPAPARSAPAQQEQPAEPAPQAATEVATPDHRTGAPVRCPACGQVAAWVHPDGDSWACESCKRYGVDYDDQLAARDQHGAPDDKQVIDLIRELSLAASTGESAELVEDGQVPDAAGAVLAADGSELQPLAPPGKRGCGVCGRIGHKRNSPKCWGDRDPRGPNRPDLQPPGVSEPAPGEDAAERAERERWENEPEPAATCQREPGCVKAGWTAGQPLGAFVCANCGLPGADTTSTPFCDGRCDTSANSYITSDGAGGYSCAGCGKPATAAATRHYLAQQADSNGADQPSTEPRSERSSDSTTAAGAQPAPATPGPSSTGTAAPASTATAAPPWARAAFPDPNGPLRPLIEQAGTQAALGALWEYRRSEFTPELEQLAGARWGQLPAS